MAPRPTRLTISYFPSCSATLDPEHHNFAKLFYEAVGDDPAGKVVVLASNGYTDTSMGGGTKLLRLQRSGCAGVLTDGRLRDFDELARYDFAAYCSGEATRAGGDHVTPFQANVPVVLDRVAVPNMRMGDAAKLVLLSFDSTIRSNLSVGLPIDIAIYRNDTFKIGEVQRIGADDPYFRALSTAWSDALKRAFEEIKAYPDGK